MKVDVYPNINKVEVYENPISVPVDASWEKVLFTIENVNDTSFVLPSQPMLDRDGDYVLKVFYNSVLADFSIDYIIDNKTITWLNRVALEANEVVEIWYAPKSAYGSVPGSGEVTSLNHLNDVNIAGPITGQLLVRNNDSKFENKSLISGDYISITNDNADITISSNPNLTLSYLSANGTLENNKAYVIDTSSSPITMQLPVSSVIGKVVSVQRLGGELLTIGRNNHKINAIDQDITIGDGETVTFRYLDVDKGWLKSSSGLTSAGPNGSLQVGDGSGSLLGSGWLVDNGHLLPSLNEQYDIGSPTNLVRDIYVSNSSIKFGAEQKALSLNNEGVLEFGGSTVATGSGIDNLSLSGTLQTGEVIKWDGNNWVNNQISYAEVSNKPALATIATSGNYADISGTPSLATVATSGSYSDLSDKPSLASVATSGNYTDINGTPSLATVATSGSYSDLSNQPSLFSGSYNDLTNQPTLGTSASLDHGSSEGDVVILDATGLPAIDGSQLTNVTTTDNTRLAKASNLSDLTNVAQARTNLGVDPLGTDNSTNVTLTNVSNNYLSINNQEITSSTIPIALGGTGAITAGAARTALGVDASGTDNSTNVTLTNTNYLSITGQEITGGTIPLGSGGTGGTDANTARTNLGLGSSATLDYGTSANNLIQLNASAKLPAVDGSLLTNLPSGSTQLDNLSDVSLTNPSVDQVLVHNGSGSFINTQLSANQVSGLATVASTGSFNDLSNTPNIFSGAYVDLTGKPNLGTASSLDHGTSDGDLVLLDATGLPPVDGSQLTGITATDATKLAILNNLSDLASATSGRLNLGLGTAATEDFGINADNLVRLDSNAKLPAIDGSQLTNLTSSSGSGMTIVELATSANGYTASANDFVLIPSGHNASYLTVTLPSAPAIGSSIVVARGGNTASSDIKITCSSVGGRIFIYDRLTPSGSHNDQVFLDSFSSIKLTLISGSGYSAIWYADFSLNTLFPLSLTKDSTSANYKLNVANESILQFNSTAGATGLGAFEDVALSTLSLSSFNNDLGLATVATSGDYSDLSNKPTLGTASALDFGTSANNLIQLNANAKLPAVDGSLLTNLPSGGGGSASVPTITAASPAATYTISTHTGIEEVFLLTPSVNCTVSLPSAATVGTGYKYNIKNLSNFDLTIDANSTQTIDGLLTQTLWNQYDSFTIISNGSNWFII